MRGIARIQLEEVTGVILAGGASSRMGSNKALLPCQGGRFIDIIHRQMKQLFPEVILVTNTPEQYQFLPCRSVTDIYPGSGPLGGIHAALCRTTTRYIFVAACDMPFLDPAVVQMMADTGEGSDVVIADCGSGFEPLHAFYAGSCLPHMEVALLSGRRNIVSFFGNVRLKTVSREAVATIDPLFRSFRNINTPDDYFSLRHEEKDQYISCIGSSRSSVENVRAAP